MKKNKSVEFAAKAAGIEIRWNKQFRIYERVPEKHVESDGKSFTVRHVFNPIDDDGDALRLAVKLGIDIKFLYLKDKRKLMDVCAIQDGNEKLMETVSLYIEHLEPYAATRLAIVRAAAWIGAVMP